MPTTEKLLELLVHEKLLLRRENNMKNDELDDELRPEYDLTKLKGTIRGKYVERYNQGTNVILLEPDVAEVFHNSEEVNEALRTLISEKV